MTPKIKIRVSKTRINAGLKDPIMQKTKSIILEKGIREKSVIQKKK